MSSNSIASVLRVSSAVEDESTTLAKVITMVTLFGVSMVCGMVPFKFARWFKRKESTGEDTRTSRLVSMMLAFGGGALMCTTFLHLLPEINSIIATLTMAGVMKKLKFSLGEFLMCAGFFTIYLVEELVHLYLHRQERKSADDAMIRGTRARDSVIMRKKTLDELQDTTTHSTANLASNDVLAKPAVELKHPHDAHVHHHVPPNATLVTSLRGLLIVLALSIHELFEGLAVGLERSVSTVWYMFGAVAAHKFVIAFCVGVELIVAGTRLCMAVAYIFIYSVVSAVGIGIGILLSNGDSTDEMEVVSVILQGLATGTLLYVVFFEILSKDRSGLLQYLATLVGFAFMFGIMLVSEP